MAFINDDFLLTTDEAKDTVTQWLQGLDLE